MSVHARGTDVKLIHVLVDEMSIEDETVLFNAVVADQLMGTGVNEYPGVFWGTMLESITGVHAHCQCWHYDKICQALGKRYAGAFHRLHGAIYSRSVANISVYDRRVTARLVELDFQVSL